MKNTDKTCLEIFQQKHAIDLLITIEEGQIGFNALQKKLGINTATLQLRLEDLQEKHFIRKTPCAQDSRSMQYSLQKRGKRVSEMLKDFRAYLIKTTP